MNDEESIVNDEEQNAPNMSARFTLSEAEYERGHTERSPLTQATVDAVRGLIAAGGHGTVSERTYEFHGPAVHVRRVVSAYMEFLNGSGREHIENLYGRAS